TNHLASNFCSYHEEAQWNQLGIAEVPDFALQLDAGAKLIQSAAVADFDDFVRFGRVLLRIGFHRRGCHRVTLSCCLASCHKDSSSSREAWCGSRPSARNCSSIY